MTQPEENKVVIDGLTRYGGLNQPNLKFIKVNVDCWEKILDLLSLRDILAMSQTCQRMHHIAGHYFRENFHGTICNLDVSGPIFYTNGFKIERHEFLRFFDTARIFDHFKHLTHYVRDNLLGSLTTLYLSEVDLNESEFYGYEAVLSNIETIQLRHCRIFNDFIGGFFDLCTKLKCLRLISACFESTEARSSMFQRTLPMLEYFQFTQCKNLNAELIPLLERNPNIKNLRIGADDLYQIPHNTSSIRLDCLNVEIDTTRISVMEYASRLKTLHSNGWYKTLRVLLWTDQLTEDEFIDEMASFDALEVLFSFRFHTNIYLLRGLKELQFSVFEKIKKDLEMIAKNLINLERLSIEGTVDHLLPFLCHTKTLKIAILDDRRAPGDALNLFKLNEMRRMSKMQRKVRIAVYEKQYLATKWKLNYVNFDLIEITRAETIQEYFDYNTLQLDY